MKLALLAAIALGILVAAGACGGTPCLHSGNCAVTEVCSGGVCVPASRGQREGTTGGRISGGAAVGEGCGETVDCVEHSVCYSDYCVGDGPLRVSLSFTTDTDLDLHVLTPAGDEIWFADRTAGGGTLDVDQCITSCGTTNHVENIVFSSVPASGTYTTWVVNFDGRAAATFNIDISGQTTQHFPGSVPASGGAESQRFTFVY